MQTNVIFDLSNVVHTKRHSSFRKNEEVSKALLIHETFELMKYVSGKYKASGIIVACDSQHVWRKDIYPAYKGNRELTRDDSYEVVIETLQELQTFFKNCTSIPTIAYDRSEADDVIAVVKDYLYNNTDSKTVIVSSDKDFVQLLDDRTVLYAHTLKKERTSEDPEFDLFMKCIRGDRNDNILSAFPYVKKTRLEKAWGDGLEYANLMETRLKDGRKVFEAYELNKALIDLSQQPTQIRKGITEEFESQLQSKAKYDYLETVKFLRQYQLKNIINNLDEFKFLFKKKVFINNSTTE